MVKHGLWFMFIHNEDSTFLKLRHMLLSLLWLCKKVFKNLNFNLEKATLLINETKQINTQECSSCIKLENCEPALVLL